MDTSSRLLFFMELDPAREMDDMLLGMMEAAVDVALLERGSYLYRLTPQDQDRLQAIAGQLPYTLRSLKFSIQEKSLLLTIA